MRKILQGLIVFVVLVSLLGACSAKQREVLNDSPRGLNNDLPAETMSFPDGFSNVAHKCDGPNMVYVIFHNNSAYGSVSVVKDDPRCSG